MTANQNDWFFQSNPDDLKRYQKEGRDLSPAINAGQRISDLRNLADVTTSELAEKTGISLQELLALEAGMMHLQPGLARRLAEQLGVAYSDLCVNNISKL